MKIQPAAVSANTSQLHRLLGAGLLVISGVALALTYFGVAPLRPADQLTPVIAYALAIVAFSLLGVSVFVLWPRVPSRPSGMSVEEFWAKPAMGGKAILIWFLVEGGGVLATVGFLLTSHPATAIAMALSIAAYWSCGPERFTKVAG
jgi:hypothetical protein